MIRLCILIANLCLWTSAVAAQEADDDSSNGAILSYIEDKLSSENRTIRLSGVEGLLASNAKIAEISIADTDGVWLKIGGVDLVWQRSALLRGRIEIETLKAQSLELLRAPLPDKTALPTPEAQPIQMPDLPVSINIAALEIARAQIDESFIGQPLALQLEGDMALAGGNLQSNLALERLDAGGGAFELIAGFANETRQLELLLNLSEPADGIVANLLQIPERPALDFRIDGSGQLSDLTVALDLSTNGSKRITGTANLSETSEGLGFDVDLGGRLDLLVGAQFSDFFAGDSAVTARGNTRSAGGFELEDLEIATGSMQITGSLNTTTDGLVERAVFDGVIGNGSSQTVLPVPGAQVSLRRSEFSLDFGNTGTDVWNARFDTGKLIIGDLTIGRSNIAAQGTASDVADPANRRVTANITGALSEFDAIDPDVLQALGDAISLDVQTDFPASGPFKINRAELSGNGVEMGIVGQIAAGVFEGKIDANIEQLAPFGGLVQRKMRGAMALSLEGEIDPGQGTFALTTNGNARDLRLGIAVLDDLITGQTVLKGGISRDPAGLRAKAFSVENDQIEITADGFFASDAANFSYQVGLTDLAQLNPDARGPVRLTGAAQGSNGRIELSADVAMDDGALLDREVEGLRTSFNGTLADGALRGYLRGSGGLGGEPVRFSGTTEFDGKENRIERLTLAVGPSLINGDLSHSVQTGLIDGTLDLSSEDISGLAALALQDASGAITANVELSSQVDSGQQIAAMAQISGLKAAGLELRSGDLDARISDAFGVPGVNGTLNFETLSAFGVEVLSGSAMATLKDTTTRFDATSQFANDAVATLSGALEQLPEGFRLSFEQFRLTSLAPDISLSRPATMRIENGELSALDLALSMGEGTVIAKGSVGSELGLTLDISEAPLAIANALRPDIAAQGTVTGNAQLFGATSAPAADFDLIATDISVAATRESNLPPVGSKITGTLRDGTTRLAADLTGPNGLESTVEGEFIAETGVMDFEGVLRRFPLILLDPLVGGPGLRGTVDGVFQVLGTSSNPRVPFNLVGRDLSARIIRENAIPPFNTTVEGSFYNNQITLPKARFTGGGGADFEISGRIPLFEDGLNVSLEGKIPLSIANVPLSESGIRAQGLIDVGLNASGTITAPSTSGQLNLAGATVVLPRVNLRLEDLGLNGRFTGNTLRIDELSARNSSGGTISANGTIGLSPSQGFPIDLSSTLSNMTYTDGRIATADFDGNFAFNGALLRRPTLSGTLNVDNAEITIPDPQPTERTEFALNITHKNPTAEIAQTLARVPATANATSSDAPGTDTVLDIEINAPSKIFVRGRGLDGEIGGVVNVNGTARAPSPVGQLNLVRGRIQVLSQRVELTTGALTFDGDLLPELILRARTVTDDVEATIGLEGPVTKPVVSFSSVPELPDDEVLAQIAFGRSLSDLSPLQIAQVASAAAEFAGRSELSFFDQIRRATGLDDLDFETSDQGATTVRAGKYIRDNVYSTIEADNLGNSKATINLDISSKVKARGSVDNEGNTSLGIFFERDY